VTAYRQGVGLRQVSPAPAVVLLPLLKTNGQLALGCTCEFVGNIHSKGLAALK
jgi:hypothetical protein